MFTVAQQRRSRLRAKSITKSARIRLWLEPLENRLVPSTAPWQLAGEAIIGGLSDFHATIVAGDPGGTPADSPSNRVDPNTTTSLFAGVGSVQVNARRGVFIGTGTPIDSTHILTAGHVVDLNDDGRSNRKDGIKNAYFIVNYGGNQTSKILVSKIDANPNFTGFNRPSINDDLAILTLGSPLPAGVPTYGLPTVDLVAGTTLTLVGYGQSGDGVNGYTVNASFTVKRVGYNNADGFYGQDDAGQPAANEVFRFDFDGPSGTGTFGGPTLGNNLETTLGGGDSGGPSFVANVVVGVNTFTQGFNTPKFGSLGGGINVFPYVSWINSVLTGGASAPASSVSADGPGTANGNPAREFLEALAAADNFLVGAFAEEAFRSHFDGTSILIVDTPLAPVRIDVAPTNRAAAATPTVAFSTVFQTTPLFPGEEPSDAESGGNQDANLDPDGAALPAIWSDLAYIAQPGSAVEMSQPAQQPQADLTLSEAKSLALAFAEQDAVLVESIEPLSDHGATTPAGVTGSPRDWVIPHSTAALAGLLMLAGGRQGLVQDENTKKKSTATSRFFQTSAR